MSPPSAATTVGKDAPARRLLLGATWLLLAQASMVPVGVAVLVYLTRRLGPSQYGQYATVMAVLLWIEFSITALLNRAAVKLVAQSDVPRRTAVSVLRVAFIAGMLGMALLWAVAGPLARALGDIALVGPLRLAAIDVPLFVMASAYLAVAAGLGRFGRRAIASSVRWPLRLGLAVLFIEAGYGLNGAIWAVIGSSIAELLLCLVLCPLPVWTGTGLSRWRLWIETLPLFGSALALRVLDGADLLLLRGFGATASEAGTYAAAMNLTVIPSLTAGAVFPVLMATMVQLRSERRPEENARMGSAVLRIGAWLIPPAAATALAAPALVQVFFGPAYAAAAPLLSILLWAGIARMGITVCAAMLAGAGRSSWTLWVVVPAVMVALIGYVTLIPRAGALGAAWSTAVASVLGVVLSLGLLSHRLNMTISRVTLVWVGATTALAVLLATVWPPFGGWALGYIGLTCLLTVLAAVVKGDLRLSLFRVTSVSSSPLTDSGE